MSEDHSAGDNPLDSRRFRSWLTASIIAGSGVGIQTVTVPLFIRDRVELDERAAAIAAALVAQNLPGAFLSPFGGALADRIEARRILAASYSIAAVVATAYVALCIVDYRQIWPVFLLAASVGAAAAFTNPARQSMLNQIVSRTQLQNAVILGTMGFMATMQFVGPAIGGIVVDFASITAAFALESILLLLGASLFSRVRTQPKHTAHGSILGDLAAGFRYIAARPELYGLLILSTIPGTLFVGPFSVTVPILVPDLFEASDRWVGLLWGCFGIGVLVGSILLTMRRLPRRGLIACASNIGGGLILVLYSQSTSLYGSAMILVLWGLCASLFMNYVVTLLQENTEPRMIGRVMSMYSFTFFASMPLGYAQAGAVTTTYGAETTLLSSGVLACLVGFAVLVMLRPVRMLP